MSERISENNIRFYRAGRQRIKYYLVVTEVVGQLPPDEAVEKEGGEGVEVPWRSSSRWSLRVSIAYDVWKRGRTYVMRRKRKRSDRA